MSRHLKHEIQKIENERGQRMVALRRKFNGILQGGAYVAKVVWKHIDKNEIVGIYFSNDRKLMAYILDSSTGRDFLMIRNTHNGHIHPTRYEGRDAFDQVHFLEWINSAFAAKGFLSADYDFYKEALIVKNLFSGEVKTYSEDEEEYDNQWFDKAFSKDGTKIASHNGKCIHIWDVDSTERLLEIDYTSWFHKGFHTEDLEDRYAFSPDSSKFAIASHDGRIQIWDLDTQRLLKTLNNSKGNSRIDYTLEFSPDNSKIASGLIIHHNGQIVNRQVKIWNIESGETIHAFDLSSPSIRMNISFSPNGKLIAVLADDNKINIMNVETGEKVLTIRQGGYRNLHIWEVYFVSDSRIFVHTTDKQKNNILKVWEIKDAVEDLTKSIETLSMGKKRGRRDDDESEITSKLRRMSVR